METRNDMILKSAKNGLHFLLISPGGNLLGDSNIQYTCPLQVSADIIRWDYTRVASDTGNWFVKYLGVRCTITVVVS